jgi:hypothetical protein
MDKVDNGCEDAVNVKAHVFICCPQIYLLAAAPSKAVTAAFRLHMHMLTGAPIAILFPVINTRLVNKMF